MDGILKRTSVSIDEAVAILLGWAKGPIVLSSSDKVLSDEEQDLDDNWMFCLNEDLLDRMEAREGDLAQAKNDGLAQSIIEERNLAFQKQRKITQLAQSYLCAVKDEINKGEESELRIDNAMNNSVYTYITMASLDAWMNKKYGKTILLQKPETASALTGKGAEQLDIDQGAPSAPLALTNKGLWLIIDPKDPPVDQDWYIPARYFARELIKDDATLLTKRDVLASKVVQSLTGVGIYKRGGKLPLSSGTVKKALSNVILN